MLALARSRYFEYDDPAEGGWNYDPTSDLGRIQRQNLIIEALIQKVESTYNPLTLQVVPRLGGPRHHGRQEPRPG